MDLKNSLFPWKKRKIRKRNIEKLKSFLSKASLLSPIDDVRFGEFENDELGRLLNKMVDIYNVFAREQTTISRAETLAVIRAQEQKDDKKRLTQNINHELKTPVSSIKGYLETILQDPKMGDKKRQEFIQKCYEQTERISNLLHDLSTITRMDEAEEIIEKEDVILSQIVEEVVSEHTFAADQKGMIIDNKLPSGLKIVGNKALLQSIFHNLIQNAIIYSDGTIIEISLSNYTSKYYTISFADNGKGVAPEHLDKIFERFYRIDKGRSRKLGGTGLGLSIVKNAIYIHGGSISAHLREGGGLEFIFSFAIR